MQIINKTKNIVIAEKAKKADTFLTRSIGLLNRRSIFKEEALIITKCRSIHMFFMKFSIDAVFVNKKNIVVGLLEKFPPFALSPIFFKADYVVEMFPGVIAEKNISMGDELQILD